MEREQFRAKLQELLESGKFVVTDTVPPDAMIVVTRAEGYDFAEDRKLWEHWENQNEARDIDCSVCGHQVVMSNGMYGKYLLGKFELKQVICLFCVKEVHPI